MESRIERRMRVSKETLENEAETSVLGTPNKERRLRAFEKIEVAVLASYEKHGTFRWGRHEAFGILLEEMDEVWEEITSDGTFEQLEEELIHVALVIVRYLETEPRFLQMEDDDVGTTIHKTVPSPIRES